MPERGSFLFSAVLHVAVVLAFVFGLPRLFESKLPEDEPIAVQLVNIAPETKASEVNTAPPTPHAKPELAQAEPHKAEPKPEPPPPPPPPPKVEPKPAPPKPVPKPKPPKPAPPPPPVQKPRPPKPPPPPPIPKPPAPGPKKPVDASFDALLKNLAHRKIAPQQDAKGPTQKTSQPIAPLATRISTSEIDLVKRQIEACWNVPAGARDAENLRPEFRVMMNPDGTVRAAQLLNRERLSDSFFQAAADSAYRALLNPRCQPLKLPLDKYDQWQTFTITFDPKDIT